jgi:serine/threonine protein phosphatase PrpC
VGDSRAYLFRGGRALGIYEQVILHTAEYSLVSQDVVLLCSDGLTRMVTDTAITNAR